jgi:hypothetical protein
VLPEPSEPVRVSTTRQGVIETNTRFFGVAAGSVVPPIGVALDFLMAQFLKGIVDVCARCATPAGAIIVSMASTAMARRANPRFESVI